MSWRTFNNERASRTKDWIDVPRGSAGAILASQATTLSLSSSKSASRSGTSLCAEAVLATIEFAGDRGTAPTDDFTHVFSRRAMRCRLTTLMSEKFDSPPLVAAETALTAFRKDSAAVFNFRTAFPKAGPSRRPTIASGTDCSDITSLTNSMACGESLMAPERRARMPSASVAALATSHSPSASLAVTRLTTVDSHSSRNCMSTGSKTSASDGANPSPLIPCNADNASPTWRRAAGVSPVSMAGRSRRTPLSMPSASAGSSATRMYSGRNKCCPPVPATWDLRMPKASH